MRRSLARAALGAALAFAPAAGAQTATVFTRPWLDWRTLRTEHFEIHFPAETREWTLDLASRLEAAHARVGGLVGPLPDRRIRVIVEDPAGQANGAAYAFLDRPTIALWPSPPDPRSNIGHTRGAAEQLALHELAHIAHLARPSRNPLERAASALLPVRVGPIDRKAPRWVIEGYATWVEGRLTGSGRPYGAMRAAVLRQWVLEGRLPAYSALSGGSGFYGQAMAYLAGSAYLEWLAERHGEESLQALWDAMSGGSGTSFAAAFQQVYGQAPDALYALFAGELASSAAEVRRRIRQAGGVVDGAPVQRLAWATGDPALSPDGERVAVVVRGAPGTPSRVVVWRTDEQESAPAAMRSTPPARAAGGRAALAQLLPVEGRAHDAPRFLPGGRRLLVVRAEPVGGGATRADLFEWNLESGALRRITRGAGIRGADPSPDGRTAAAVRCAGGICDLVRVDLRTGNVAVLAAGGPELVFHRPRWSPAGDRILVSVQLAGVWRLAVVEAATGQVLEVDPADGAARYDGAWLPDGRVVATSERGGIANLEVIDPSTAEARPLTRVTGAAVAAEVDPRSGAVFFLSLHAAGLDLHRIHPDSAAPSAVELPARLAPAVPPVPASAVDTLERTPLGAPLPYGLGPRATRTLPSAAVGADGLSLGWMISNADPVGRLTLLARGTVGGGDVPRGLAGSALWRGWRTPLALDAWWREDGTAGYAGAGVRTEAAGRSRGVRHRLAGGGSAGRLGEGERVLAWGGASADAARTVEGGRLSAGVHAGASAGSTAGDGWAMGAGGAHLGLARGPLSLRLDGGYAAVSPGAPAFEHPTAGGRPDPLVPGALLAQRTPMPVLRRESLSGPALGTGRVSIGYRGVRPYLWGAAAGGRTASVAGVDWELVLPASNVLDLPGMRFDVGAGIPLSGGAERRPRLHLGVDYRL